MPKRRKKRFLTVYTTSSTERGPKGIECHTASGTFLARGDAIRECARDIMFTVGARPDMRSLFVRDERVRKALRDGGMTDEMIDNLADDSMEDEDAIMDKAAAGLKELLVDIIGGQSCMTFGSDLVEFRFDVDENDVVCSDGLQLWTCITSGTDSDRHDQEFEQPFPEVFLSEEEAMECALEDLRQCLDGYGRSQKTEILCEARDKLENDGYYKFDLNDSTSRRWDIWSTPIDIGQGARKIQRH